jgi:hypothetical protein
MNYEATESDFDHNMNDMNILAAANVRKSFKLLANGAPPFSSEVGAIASEAGQGLRNLFSNESLAASPIFYRINRDLCCAQTDFFGFYLLSQGIRSCLSSVNFHIAGCITLESELYAPAVALFYTSAYHALSGFLAVHGRVLLDSEVFTWISSEEKPPVIAACLTKNNNWKYERRTRSHTARWLELKNLFALNNFQIPSYFRQLFRSLYGSRRKPGATVYQLLTEPDKYRAQIEDYTDDFLKRIAEVRHAALYKSSGEDPHVVEAMVNREPVYSANLGRHAQEIGVFSQGLLDDASRSIRDMIESVVVHNEVKLYLYLGAGQPWVDEARCDLWGANSIQQNVDFIQRWLMLPSKEGSREKIADTSNAGSAGDG